jgi:hypothetical protein
MTEIRNVSKPFLENATENHQLGDLNIDKLKDIIDIDL